MYAAIAIVVAAALSVPIGLDRVAALATLRYRTPAEQHLPTPGPRKWVLWCTVAVITSLTAVATLSGDPLLFIPLAALAIPGPWLAAIDADVMRLPNRILGLTAAVATSSALAIGLYAPRPSMVFSALTASVVAAGLFTVFHLLTKGGVGFGDVKLVAVMGLVLGPLGLEFVWLALLIGTIAAVVWAKATKHHGPLAYGPWLLLGGWVAALISPIHSSLSLIPGN